MSPDPLPDRVVRQRPPAGSAAPVHRASCRRCSSDPAVVDGLCGRCWVVRQAEGETRTAQAHAPRHGHRISR